MENKNTLEDQIKALRVIVETCKQHDSCECYACPYGVKTYNAETKEIENVCIFKKENFLTDITPAKLPGKAYE